MLVHEKHKIASSESDAYPVYVRYFMFIFTFVLSKKKKKRKEEKWGMIQNLFAGCDNCAEHTTPSHQHDSFSFGKARKALLRAMLR